MGAERLEAASPSLARWTLVTGAGWFAGFFAGFVLAGALEPIVGRGPAQSVVAYGILGAFLGAGVGLLQWLILRSRFAGSGAWVWAGAIGMGLAGNAGYGIAVLIFGYSEGLEDLGSATAVAGWMLAAAFGGVVTGLLQRRVLSRHRRGAGWWVPATAAGWTLSIAAFGSVGVLGTRLAPAGSPVGAGWFFLGLIAGGLVLGVATGTAIGRLLSLKPGAS
jgi:hypothetical protein